MDSIILQDYESLVLGIMQVVRFGGQNLNLWASDRCRSLLRFQSLTVGF